MGSRWRPHWSRPLLVLFGPGAMGSGSLAADRRSENWSNQLARSVLYLPAAGNRGGVNPP